jgi:hypothetical protein
MTAIDGVVWETFDDAGVVLQSVSTLDDFHRAFEKQGSVNALQQP